MKKTKIGLILILIILFSSAILYTGHFLSHLYIHTHDQWSIGINLLTYDKNSGFKLVDLPGVKNPILTYQDITDQKAEFVADPFIVKEDNKLYVFFETKNIEKGVISLAESDDGIKWAYKGTVLHEPFHLSFPNVFKFNDKYYMVPESGRNKDIRLYQSFNFPYDWRLAKVLIKGKGFVDPTIFSYQKKWWILTTEGNYLLRLYYADDLMGNWTEHPKSPVVKNNPNTGRLGGNIIKIDNRIIRIAQDCFPTYGNSIRVFEITTLTDHEYKEKELRTFPQIKILKTGWNQDGIHTFSTCEINKDEWLVCMDGSTYKSSPYISSKYRIKIDKIFLKLLNF